MATNKLIPPDDDVARARDDDPEDLDSNIGVLRYIKVKDLQIDEEYQRKLRTAKVQNIAENLDLNLIGTLDVAARKNGSFTYYIYDGQHRHAALKARGLGERRVACNVRFLSPDANISQQLEAFYFEKQNTQRANPTPIDIFRSQLVSGNEQALRLQAILDRHNIEVSDATGYARAMSGDTGVSANTRALTAIGRTMKLHAATSDAFMDEVFAITTSTWSRSRIALEGLVIEGVADFWAAHRSEIDLDTVVAFFKTVNPEEVMIEARDQKQHRQHSVAAFFAWMMEQHYNRRRTTKRLKEIPVAQYANALRIAKRRKVI